MKSSLLFTLLLCVLTATIAEADHSPMVEVVKTDRKDIFTLKMDKKFMGAQIEVLTVGGVCVICQQVSRRKMNINLIAVEPGTYTIQVVKNGVLERFQFVKE